MEIANVFTEPLYTIYASFIDFSFVEPLARNRNPV